MSIKVSTYLCLIVMMPILGCARSENTGQHIFSYQELQDSVEYFVLNTLPLLDTLDHSIFTSVIFRIDKEDTLVIVSPANIPFVCLSGRDTIIGAGMLGGRICEVVYSSTGLIDSLNWLGSIINYDGLTIPRKDYDSLVCIHTIKQDYWDYPKVEKAAILRHSYILNRPNHLMRAK